VGVIARAQAAEPGAPRLSFGQAPDPVHFTDIRYLRRSLSDFGKKRAYVVVFTTLECPMVRRSLPILNEMWDAYRTRDVQFLALNVGVDDPLVEVANQALEAELGFPVGKDFDGAAAQALGVTRTPEVVLLDADYKLRYRGRISSRVRLGGISPAQPQEELRSALDDLLAGRPVAVRETPVDGCAIEFESLKTLPARIPSTVTFSEHIAPLLAKHCQECHRPGTAAPFSLITFRDALAHAEMLAEVVRSGQMPPSFASQKHGQFENLRTLSPEERALVLGWVQQGKQEGDPAKLPPAREFPQTRWKIGEPDLILSAPQEVAIPATGFLPYQHVILPRAFLYDTWMQKVEILPSNKSVVHHCNLGYIKVGEQTTTKNLVTGYVPGGDALDLDRGLAYCIPAGSFLVLQLHYVTTGRPETDRTSVGITFAKERIQRRLRLLTCVQHDISIPPGEGNHLLAATDSFPCNATGIGLFSHMHLRGKDMQFLATRPDGSTETLLSIANYDFNWQVSYRWPEGKMKFSRGTKVTARAHFDNSPFNAFNPDSTVTVTEGEQSFNEMMYGMLFYTDDDERLDLAIDPKTGWVLRPSDGTPARRRQKRGSSNPAAATSPTP